MPFSSQPSLSALIARLEQNLARPLPGWTAQSRLSPRSPGGEPLRRELRGGRPAAGLLLFYPLGSAAGFVLTVRSETLPKHPGQVGLPGGRVEAGESLEEAALRETREEIGVDSKGIRILGALTPVYIPPSDSELHPFAACLDRTPDFIPHPGEVERILQVPLASFLDPAALREETRVLRGESVVVPYYALEGEKVWGATGMVLSEAAAILDEAR
jgi:8-oxo-dGTP pyrophosphatase MutT (NUDIX family)